MPSWYYDHDAFHKTPSIQDGIDFETEYAYRKEGVRLIMDIGTQMDLGCNTMATGVVFFHRFYMFHSFITFPRFVTACCCIFLAGKVEETPKKCKDIIKIAQTLLNEEAFSSFGKCPKDEVMTLEKILLQTIKFDLKVEHPYSYLIKYAKHLKGDKNRLHKMVQMAWTFINDSLCTTLCLQWEPEIIAIALMYLAGKLSKFKVVSWSNKKAYHTKWWDLFVEKLPMSTLEDICHQVLDLYSTVKDKPQESRQDSPQIIKEDPEIKLENPVKQKIDNEKIDSQQIQVKTEEKNIHYDSKIAKEVYSNPNTTKQEPFIDSTVDVYNIKAEPEFSQAFDQPKQKIVLHVAEWASVSASSVMSPGTSSVNSPSFPTPNFLISPVSNGFFNNRFNESTNHQNVNFNKNSPVNCQESKNGSATPFNNQNSVNFTDVTRHISQSYNVNKLCNNVPLDNCRDNLSTSSRGFDNCNDNLTKFNREFDKRNDSVQTSYRSFGNCNTNVPFRSRGFDNCKDDVPFGNRDIDNVNENLADNKYNFKIDDFSKNYQSCDMFIQDYPDSNDLYNKFKYAAKIRNNRDPRTNFRDYPYLKLENGFCMNSFPGSSNNSYENDINFERYGSKQSGRRFRNSRRFRGPINN